MQPRNVVVLEASGGGIEAVWQVYITPVAGVVPLLVSLTSPLYTEVALPFTAPEGVEIAVKPAIEQVGRVVTAGDVSCSHRRATLPARGRSAASSGGGRFGAAALGGRL